MSGTASRFQGRFGYAPELRVGGYPPTQPVAPVAPVAGMVSPIMARPSGVSPLQAMAAPQPALEAPHSVMAGSMDPERRQAVGDGAGSSAQGEYGGPGPSGIGSTGSVLGDIAGFGRDAGQAVAGMASGPMGPVGFGLGAMASGLAAAFGAPQTAADIARSIGLPGVAPTPYSYTAAGEDFGGPKGTETEYGMSSTPPGTPALGPTDLSQLGPAPDKDSLGAPTAEAFGGAYGDKGDFGGTAGGDVAGTSSENTGSGVGGEDGGAKMRGGYTGTGKDGILQADRVSGTHHEGEVVIPAHAVARYGLDPLLMLARGQVSPSRLSALLTR